MQAGVHICYGYGIKANIDWKATLGSQWRHYEETFPLLARSTIDQVSLECRNSRVPIELMGLLKGKDVLVGAIDVASNVVETPRGSGADDPRRIGLCASRAAFPLHQLRHGADVRRGGLRQARRAFRRRGARAPIDVVPRGVFAERRERCSRGPSRGEPIGLSWPGQAP